MSEAPISGLRRVAAAPVAKTLAKMTGEELLAALSDDQRTSLAASLAAAAPKKDPACDEDGDVDEEGNPVPKPAESEASDTAPAASAADAATARMSAVFASEAAKGREAQAAKLLGNTELASLSADSIIGLLADMPLASASEDNGAAAILAAIGANNANLGGGNEAEPVQAANHGWGEVIAKVQSNFS